MAAGLGGEAQHRAEAEAAAAPPLLGGEERLEGAGGHLARHAAAGIAHLEDDAAAGPRVGIEIR